MNQQKPGMVMTWANVCAELKESGLLQSVGGGSEAIAIRQVTCDSRIVRPDGLFVAIRGRNVHGKAYMQEAVDRGAAAIVGEDLPDALGIPGVAFAQVSDARKALAALVATHSGSAHRELKLYGVTGTNGKTTTCYLLHHVFSKLDGKCGMLGTVEYRCGDNTEVSPLTTPDPELLHQLFRQMIAADCKACVLEVSSHALEQDRVWGLEFDAGVFTNLSQDHLDYHGTFAEYRESKRKLFTGLGPDAAAVYNVDDPSSEWMISGTAAQVLSYGKSSAADIRFSILDHSLRGLRLRLDGRECTCRMAGRFNGYNVAAAYATALSAGYCGDAVAEAIGSSPQVPGRLERIEGPDGSVAVVDYAHTPDALKNVLRTLRQTRPEGARLWCVFGCGGDRDRGKRPTMGQIAEALADHVIVTSDNPRSESQAQIFRDIRSGMKLPDAARWIKGRREAIHVAIAEAFTGDVILIAGRGHEVLQTARDGQRTLDDRLEARRALMQRGGSCSTT